MQLDIEWEFSSFDLLGNVALYEILKARVDVFVVEQKCPYPEIDGYDQRAHHLMAWARTVSGKSLAGYLRILPPGAKWQEPALGRVLTTAAFRGRGVGGLLFKRGIEELNKLYPDRPIRLSAQRYAEDFYGAFGFVPASEPYDEDGIQHIDMLLQSRNTYDHA